LNDFPQSIVSIAETGNRAQVIRLRKKAHWTILFYDQGGTFMSQADPFNLNRFVTAQKTCYPDVQAELAAGHKQSHWMWFIFPQIDGLGFSSRARFYAIKSLGEARAYLAHPVLGPRLIACAKAMLKHRDKTAHAILGSPDDAKLCSSMTLFECAAPEQSVFGQVLDTLFSGVRDLLTQDILRSLPQSNT